MIVQERFFTFTKDEIPFTTESGYIFDEITVAYETYGKLNKNGDNAILVLHALSGDHHAAGLYSPIDKKPGWWDPLIGPGKPLDSNKYYIICSNVLGGCRGTTGPSSINPKTGKPYAADFPVINIRDMVRLQKILLAYLGVKRLVLVIGGSMGGMQALEWAVTYPDFVDSAVVIAATERLSPLAIAYNYVAIKAITGDLNWNNGNYYNNKKSPDIGLSLARMVGTITYKSDMLFKKRFGRNRTNDGSMFQVESYLNYHGVSFLKRFDANSYLYLLQAMNLHDISTPYGSLNRAIERIHSRLLLIGIETDLLYFPKDLKEFVQRVNSLGGNAKYSEISTLQGHDSFLIDFDKLGPIIKGFLEEDCVEYQKNVSTM